MKDTTNQGRDEEGSAESQTPADPPSSPEHDASADQEAIPVSPRAEDEPSEEVPDPGTKTPESNPEPEVNPDYYPEPSMSDYYTAEGMPLGEPAQATETESPAESAETSEVPAPAPAEPPAPAPPPPPSTPVEEEGEEGEDDAEGRELGARMTFLEHLDELRRRILYSIIGLSVGFAVCWVFREEIFHFIRRPIDDVVKQLVMTKPTEAFTIYMKVAFIGGIFVAIPFILVQVWMFIAPGLYRKEKRFAFPFLLSSTGLFILGGAFAYYIVLPPALRFLILEFGSQFTPMITAMDYFDLVFLIVVGMGAVFQLPVLIAFLSIFGLVTPRFLWKNFRYAFLLITIAAAIVSPTTDPFNLLLWTGPMVVLYLIGIVVSWVFKRRRAKREAAEAAG
ncbi:MAG: twin-arginine translocase subunit TatC [Acidobacteria bacterium]|nr:MAG: twin-arginine translocase subunit TatC [Acidobacteriota bacterium]